METHPLASVTVSVYTVVALGEADGEQLPASERPAAGAQAHTAPPEPESGVAPPGQIPAVPEATAVGRSWTTTAAAPVAVPEQCASETAVTVYVAVAAGETDRLAGEAATPDWVTPSDQVTLHGPVPVSAAWTPMEPPAQISPPPDTAAAGRGSTVTVTAGALTETQPFPSVTVRTYVVVEAGAASGEQLAGFESPAAGAHEHDAPPEPESGVDPPAQISAEPPAEAVGRRFTTTAALPDAVPAQCASLSAVTV